MDTIDFGNIAAGAQATKQFSICNTGTASGQWSATVQGDTPMWLQPASGELQPGAKHVVTATIADPQPGSIAAEITLTDAKGTQAVKAPVTGTITKAAVEMLNEYGQGATEVRSKPCGNVNLA